MWKYVVTWCIVVMTSVPKSEPPDEFGRESNSFWYETEISNDCGHERWFNDRKEAFAFHQRAMNETTRWFTTLNGDSVSFPQAGQLDKVKIDSIMVPRGISDTLVPYQIWDSAVYIQERWELDSIKVDRSQLMDTFQIRGFDFRSPKEMAVDLPDSTIIGYDFITYEGMDSKALYSAYNAEYEFLDKLAKADRLIKGYEHIENLFTWVHCKENDVRCFNEQFMREVMK